MQQALSRSLAELARWWDQFASVEVGSIEGIRGEKRSNRPKASPPR